MKKIDHLADRTDRHFVVQREGGMVQMTDLVKVENLPPMVAQHPALVESINHLALAAAGAILSLGIHKTKPARVNTKIARIIEGLKDKEVYDRLNMELSPGAAGRMMKELERALRQRPLLNSVELAQSVADELRRYRIPVNTSKRGALVRTLECIGSATGFKTNSEHAARSIK